MPRTGQRDSWSEICRDLWSRFVVRRDWNFAKSGKLAAIFQKLYRSEDPAKDIGGTSMIGKSQGETEIPLDSAG
jgi:hypothetical protein